MPGSAVGANPCTAPLAGGGPFGTAAAGPGIVWGPARPQNAGALCRADPRPRRGRVAAWPGMARRGPSAYPSPRGHLSRGTQCSPPRAPPASGRVMPGGGGRPRAPAPGGSAPSVFSGRDRHMLSGRAWISPRERVGASCPPRAVRRPQRAEGPVNLWGPRRTGGGEFGAFGGTPRRNRRVQRGLGILGAAESRWRPLDMPRGNPSGTLWEP